MPRKDYKYKAFISYSHQDKQWGDWLHKALETYRIPKGLVGKETRFGTVPKRLFPIFRDREELPTSAELGEVINQALDDSSHLIVICSPRSAKSQWVNEEIKEFKRLGKSDQVLCLIVDGEPNAADKPDLGQEECFPEAAKYKVGDDGELSNVQAEPIAADAREGKDGKRNALLKLVAGLLAVGFDDIKQRDLARKQKRLVLLSSFSLALVAVMAGLTFWALDQQQQAERQRAEAVTARDNEATQRLEAETQREAAVKALEKAERENYFNAIALAQVKINENLYGQAEELLWATPKTLRNWEWGRLMHLCHLELLTLKGHGNVVYSAVFSPDGRLVLTASEDKTAKLWDAESGKELLTLKGQDSLDGRVRSAAFSPDGHRVLTTSEDHAAKIWDAESGEELLTLKGQVISAAFSPDGRRVLTGGKDTAKIWDAENGEELLTLKGHGNVLYSAVFSPDGRLVLTASADKTAKIWDSETGKELHTLKGHDSKVYSAVFSPDGRRVLTASADNTAKIWDAGSGKELLTFKGHASSVRVAVFSPDRRLVVTASIDKAVKVWDAEAGEELLTFKGHEKVVLSVNFSPDGRRVLTASFDRTAKIWDVESGEELRTLNGYDSKVTAFSPDGRWALTESADKTAKIWDAETGKELLTLTVHKGEIEAASFNSDGRRLVTTGPDYTAKILDAVDWTLTKEEFLEQKRQRYEKWVKANVSKPE